MVRATSKHKHMMPKTRFFTCLLLASMLLCKSADASAPEEGISLYEAQQFSRAVQAFESARNQTMSDSRSAYYYALSLNSAGHTDKATVVCKQIVAKFPRTEAAKQAAAAIKSWANFKATAAASAAAREAYIGQKLDANLGVIGVKYEIAAGRLPVVRFVFPGGPADKVVQAGDVITEVDDKPTKGLSKEEVYDLIVGDRASRVSLTLQRKDLILKESFVRMSIADLSRKYPAAWKMYSEAD